MFRELRILRQLMGRTETHGGARFVDIQHAHAIAVDDRTSIASRNRADRSIDPAAGQSRAAFVVGCNESLGSTQPCAASTATGCPSGHASIDSFLATVQISVYSMSG
jgi:hypothetical protein